MKKNSVILIVILLLSIFAIGISFSYYIVGAAFEGEGSNVTGEAPKDLLSVIYDGGTEEINASGIKPGDSITKEFSVTVTPTNKQKNATYEIRIDINSNTFQKCEENNNTWESFTNECKIGADELVYTLTDGDNNVLSSGSLEGKTNNEIIIEESKTVSDTTTFEYILTIEFVETEFDQNHNTNKVLDASLVVEFTDSDTASEAILANNNNIRTRSSIKAEFMAPIIEETNNVIYQGNENNGLTYYFAGAPTNNYVEFAGFYWRIIRINENGSIRMIYSGEKAKVDIDSQGKQKVLANGYNDASTDYTLIETAALYNEVYDSTKYLGFMYSDDNGEIINSNIKNILENWYQNNIYIKGYAKYIDHSAGFCNDLSSTNNAFNAYNRIYIVGSTGLPVSESLPTFDCNSEYLYKTSIGLISADEVNYAGGVYGSVKNNSFYLRNNQHYWTMTPWGSNINNISSRLYIVWGDGTLQSGAPTYSSPTIGVRPVINLKSSVTLNGGGTISNPYTVSF